MDSIIKDSEVEDYLACSWYLEGFGRVVVSYYW
jgi:hypothetical protein